MTTARDVKMLVKPLIEANGDLAVADRRLIFRPVEHFVRGVLIDRTSSKDNSVAYAFTLPLFFPPSEGGIGWGWDLRGRDGYNWFIGVPDVREELVRLVQEDVLPKLRPVRSLQDCYDFILTTWNSHILVDDPIWRSLIDLAVGKPPQQRALLDTVSETITRLRGHKTIRRDMERYRESADKLEPLRAAIEADGYRGALRVMHEWERLAVERQKLTPFWKPTPFPVEDMGLV